MLAKKLTAITALGAFVLSGCMPGSSESDEPEVPMGKSTPYKRIAAQPSEGNSMVGKLIEAGVFQSTITVGEKTDVDCLFTESSRGASIECNWDGAVRRRQTSEPVKPVYEKVNLVPEKKTPENDTFSEIYQFPKEAKDEKFVYCLLLRTGNDSAATCDWKNPITLKD